MVLTIIVLVVKNAIVRTLSVFSLFFLVGILVVSINDDRNYKSYYKNHFKDNSTVILQIHKILKPSNYYNKYEAEVIQVDSKKTKGTILLNVQKDSTLVYLNVDDQIILKPIFKELIPPLNPHQFDYKFYLAKQGIYQQLFVNNKEFLKQKNKENTLYGMSAGFRFKIQKALNVYRFKNDELAVINALLLGQRQNISKELISDYQRAGAIHILAVSGLHVGVILLILSFLLKPLERIKNGILLKTIIIVILLWIFAFIAGLSASVVRAVTMFTFVAIGMSFKRKNIVEFSFISSMFFLLLIKPIFLFDIGFQLSYLAVFGILWTQPKIYSIWKPKFKIIDFFWKLLTVSIAAQIGILPLSIYYFQQFPGLFLASNLVIIPFLGAILLGGILVISLSLLKLLPQVFADVYGSVISLMNSFVSWVSHQEDFLFQELFISYIEMLFWYFFIFCGIQFFISKSYKKLMLFFISIVLLQSLFLLEKGKNNAKKEIIIFHKSRFSIIGKRIGEKLFLQHDLDSLLFIKESSLKSYTISEGVKEVYQTNFKNFFRFKNKNILLVDSLGIYKLDELNNPIVVLQCSPKINLKRLIKKIKPLQIIADGSNYKSYIIRWKNICLEYEIPFHYTGEKGAFKIK